MDFQAKQADQNVQDEADKDRKKNSINQDLTIQESDYRKALSEKNQLESELRALKKDEAHIKIAMQEKQIKLEKLTQEIFRLETEIKSLKKKFNTL